MPSERIIFEPTQVLTERKNSSDVEGSDAGNCVEKTTVWSAAIVLPFLPKLYSKWSTPSATRVARAEPRRRGEVAESSRDSNERRDDLDAPDDFKEVSSSRKEGNKMAILLASKQRVNI